MLVDAESMAELPQGKGRNDTHERIQNRRHYVDLDERSCASRVSTNYHALSKSACLA